MESEKFPALPSVKWEATKAAAGGVLVKARRALMTRGSGSRKSSP